jgi:hypothetical protein
VAASTSSGEVNEYFQMKNHLLRKELGPRWLAFQTMSDRNWRLIDRPEKTAKTGRRSIYLPTTTDELDGIMLC